MNKNNKIILKFSPLAEYIIIARLAVSGAATRKGFNYQEIEEIKLAMGEVSNILLEHATAEIYIEITIDMSKDNGIEISSQLTGIPDNLEELIVDTTSLSPFSMSYFIIDSLMDGVKTYTSDSKPVKLVFKKYMESN